jgi:hypothetical protein
MRGMNRWSKALADGTWSAAHAELSGVAAGSGVVEDVQSTSRLPWWKKAGGFGLLWGGLRSDDSWSCGLRMASLKEGGGVRVTQWPAAWGGGGGGTTLTAH